MARQIHARAAGGLVLVALMACTEAPAPIATAADAAIFDDLIDAANLDAATDPIDATGADPTDAADLVDAAGPTDAAPPTTDAASTDAGSLAPDAAARDAGAADAATTSTTPAPRPIVFIHGIGGSSTEFAVMIDRLVADGWPRNYLVALDFPDPRWGCNVDNAAIIAQTVQDLLARTGQPRIDLVAHSMGVLSSRHYLKNLGGTNFVNTYVTLGGMHHGDRSACLNPLPVCVWQEICPTRPFLTQLNDPPATPGPSTWVSIFSTDDDRVSNASSMLVGAENVQVSGPVHAGPTGILESALVYPEVRRVLRYPPW